MASTLAAARDDPGWITKGPAPVLIDEFQRELLQAIKAELNTDLRPGRFVLTGSTTYDSLPRTSQSLTGRARIGTLWPLSQGEIDGTREQFLERILADPLSILDLGGSDRTRADYVDRIVRGGYPLAVARDDEADRRRWFTSHLRLVLQRDVLDVSRIHQQQELPRLLARLASQLGSTVNVTAAAQSLGIAPRTAESYAALLEAVHLTYPLPAWSRLIGPTVAKKPKMHLHDSGLASHVRAHSWAIDRRRRIIAAPVDRLWTA